MATVTKEIETTRELKIVLMMYEAQLGHPIVLPKHLVEHLRDQGITTGFIEQKRM